MLGARCYRLALLVRVSGTSGCGTCMHVLATADKSRENRSLPLRGEGEGYSRKISCQASGPPHSARTPPRALRLATLSRRERECCGARFQPSLRLRVALSRPCD